jgi:hypothetical protein
MFSCIGPNQAIADFSYVKQKKSFRTSLISTRLVKWPEANIGHCFLANKAMHIHIYIVKRKEGTRSESCTTTVFLGSEFAYIITFELKMVYDIYTYQRIQDKHVHNIVHKKDINKLAKLNPCYYHRNIVNIKFHSLIRYKCIWVEISNVLRSRCIIEFSVVIKYYFLPIILTTFFFKRHIILT